ncbi:MAG: EAL domain-containing protein [Acidobacteriota bacterium]|nr:EAL domain-containing protein [Acidobacteriota bacterium]MDH3524857.1 EAL domain-containing protein [Acidobacteriota bacterium]
MAAPLSGTKLRSRSDRRSGKDRRQASSIAASVWRLSGSPERRQGQERRSGRDRRRAADVLVTDAKIDAALRVIEERQLDVVYQPIYHLSSGKVFGYEALARVDSADFSTLPELFRAASAAGRVGELGRLHRAQAVAGGPSQPLFLNIFPTEFDYGLLVRPDDAIFRHRYPVYVEVTESVPLSHFEQCIDVLGELRKKGVLLVIDDLGAGYSNLKYVADLAPDIVKLDRNLIADVRDGSRQERLVRAIVDLCHEMGAEVVAEGIETVDELIVAQRAGVEYCQGYLLGRPSARPNGASWPGFVET